MDWRDPETGRTWCVHHNGDFSGGIVFDRDDGFHQRVEEEGRCEIPFRLLQEIVGRYYIDEAVDKLQDSTGVEFLERGRDGST